MKDPDSTSLIGTIILFITVIVIGYGGWKFQRWYNYKTSYSAHVAEQMQPIVDRIDILEKRIVKLENK